MTLRARRNTKDIAAGLLFAFLGLGFATIAYLGLPIGTATQMGPGYFPVVLGGLLVLIGVATALRGWAIEKVSDFGPIPWRGALFTALALIFFALTLRGLGMALTVFISTLLGSMASSRATPPQALATGVVLAAICTLIFGEWLGVAIPIIGPWARVW